MIYYVQSIYFRVIILNFFFIIFLYKHLMLNKYLEKNYVQK